MPRVPRFEAQTGLTKEVGRAPAQPLTAVPSAITQAGQVLSGIGDVFADIAEKRKARQADNYYLEATIDIDNAWNPFVNKSLSLTGSDTYRSLEEGNKLLERFNREWADNAPDEDTRLAIREYIKRSTDSGRNALARHQINEERRVYSENVQRKIDANAESVRINPTLDEIESRVRDSNAVIDGMDIGPEDKKFMKDDAKERMYSSAIEGAPPDIALDMLSDEKFTENLKPSTVSPRPSRDSEKALRGSRRRKKPKKTAG
jgi:hypothetical protein